MIPARLLAISLLGFIMMLATGCGGKARTLQPEELSDATKPRTGFLCRLSARQGPAQDELFDPFAKADEGDGEEYAPWEPLNLNIFEFIDEPRAIASLVPRRGKHLLFRHGQLRERGSPTTSAVVRPDGTLLCYQPYGKEGLLIADIDISEATGLWPHAADRSVRPPSKSLPLPWRWPRAARCGWRRRPAQ